MTVPSPKAVEIAARLLAKRARRLAQQPGPRGLHVPDPNSPDYVGTYSPPPPYSPHPATKARATRLGSSARMGGV